MIALLLACAPSIAPDTGDSGDTGAPAGDLIVDGTMNLDATHDEDWVYVDLDGAALVESDDPSWDLSFRRYVVALNGGVSGDGVVEAAVLEGQDFDALTQAPADGYVTDLEDANGDGTPEYALLTWYDYDFTTHILTPADKVYVIHTGEDAYFKLRFDSYYDDAGTPAMLQTSVAAIDAP